MTFQITSTKRSIGIISLIFFLFIFPGCRKKQSKDKISKTSFSISELYFKEAQKQAINGEFHTAESYFLKSYQENPTEVKSLLHLSYLYRITKNHKKGITVLQKIVKEFPGTKEAKSAQKEIDKLLGSLKKQM